MTDQRYLVRVDTGSAVCGFVVDRNGDIDWQHTAPYAVTVLKRAGVTTGREAVKHFRSQGHSVTWVPIGSGHD